MGAKIDKAVMNKSGPFTYRIHGKNHHSIGSLVPRAGQPPKFLQLYIFDIANEVKNRISAVGRTTGAGELDESIVKDLIMTVDTYNCLAKVSERQRDIYENGDCQEF